MKTPGDTKTANPGPQAFPTDVSGLTAAAPPAEVRLGSGDRYALRIHPVAKLIGDATVRMLSYNGSIPGPTLRVAQGSEVTMEVANDGDVEATVHWHGVRVDNRYDGVPEETQAPIPIGGTYTYKVKFPDAGIYWYHPHIREDFAQEMGLYGTIVVEPRESSYWPPVDREITVTLDDVLIEDGRMAPFLRSGPTFTAMGRFGNVMLTNGETAWRRRVSAGEVVRFYLVNTANTRLFNLALPGARMKLVGGDSGRYEHERFVDEVMLAPSERAVVDVLFEAPGRIPIEHRVPDHVYELGAFEVTESVGGSSAASFEVLRHAPELAEQRRLLPAELERAPDKTLSFTSSMPLLYGSDNAEASAFVCPMHPEVTDTQASTCPKCGMKLVPSEEEVPTSFVCPMHPEVTDTQASTCPKCGMRLISAEAAAGAEGTEHHEQGAHEHDAHEHGAHDHGDGLEWEDLMPDINRRTDPSNMIWRLVDAETGDVNADISWAFTVGDRVKIRLINEMEGSDHPMHHPFHVHGAGRFLVLSRDGRVEDNLVWKDTVLLRAGETVDILLEVTSPGLWMAHCHIAEHTESGMMFSFNVKENHS